MSKKKSPVPETWLADPLLADFFNERFIPEQLKDRHRDTARAYRRAVDRFKEFMTREPALKDLNRETCDGFEAWLKAAGHGVTGGRCGYVCIVAIWRYAYVVEVVDNKPPQKRTKGPGLIKKFLNEPATEAPSGAMFLIDYVRAYALERSLELPSVAALRHVVNNFGRFLKRRARLSDLSSDIINRWIVDCQESKAAPETIRSRRVAICCLWRAAYDAELVPRPPERIRKVKVPQKLPTAWYPCEMTKLLEAAGRVLGRFQLHGVKRCDFWAAWILVAHHSGLRRGDLVELRFDQITPAGHLVVVQHKTGDTIRRQMPDSALDAIRAISIPKRRRIFGDVLSVVRIRKEFRSVIQSAGLRGSTKQLRRTGATWCEVEKPGSAKEFLGHRTPGLAYRSYVDPRHLKAVPVGPQAIDLTKPTPAPKAKANRKPK